MVASAYRTTRYVNGLDECYPFIIVPSLYRHYVALGTSLSRLLSHHLSLANNHDVLAAEFLLELAHDFGLDLLPADYLRSWDHEDQRVSAANVNLFHGNELKKEEKIKILEISKKFKVKKD